MRRLGSSTSGHRLNGDRRLSTGGKIAYFFLNWLNNTRPYAQLDPRLEIRDFVCPALSTEWATLPPGASPSRRLSDLFWLTLPWPAIRAELGEAHILDVGCGSGGYGPRLLASAAGEIATYTGTDARQHEHWPRLEASDPRLRFYQSHAENFFTTIPAGTNLFVSQSAIEHFDEDLTFFRQIRDYVAVTRGPVLQIHLAPSPACLGLYYLHGVRQYTPRTLSRITRLFAAEDLPTAFRLGGTASNRLHYHFISKPRLLGGRDLRTERAAEYDRRLFEAVSDDMRRHPQTSPAFWALVIQSRPRTRIFP